METPELKSKISGKNSLNQVNNIMEMTEEKFNELEDRQVGINQFDEYIERNEQSLRKLWDNIKRYKICVVGFIEEERRRDCHLKEEHTDNGILFSTKR